MAAKVGRLTNEAISLIVTGRKITVAEAMEPWLEWLRSVGRSENTIAQSKIFLAAFSNHANVSHVAPSLVLHEQINAWVNDHSPAKVSTRSVRLAIVRSFFRFCAAKGWCIGDPSQLVEVNLGALNFAQKEARKRPVFTDQEVSKLIAATLPGSFWRAAVPIARWTGLRLCDIAGLEWASLEEPGKIIVWTQKRDKRVSLPLEPDELRLAVAGIQRVTHALRMTTNGIQRVSHTHCFPEQNAIIKDPRRRSLLSRQFEKLALSCGISNTSVHALRATYVTAQKAAGIPIEHIQLAVGHSSEAQTRNYIRP